MTEHRRYHVTQIEITDHREARAPHSDEWALAVIIENDQEMAVNYLFDQWRRISDLDARSGQTYPHDPAAIADALDRCAAGFDGRYLQQRLDKVPFDNVKKTTPGLDKLAVTLFVRDNYFDGLYGVSETQEGSEIHHNGDIMNHSTLVIVPYLEDEDLEPHQARVQEVVRALEWAALNPA